MPARSSSNLAATGRNRSYSATRGGKTGGGGAGGGADEEDSEQRNNRQSNSASLTPSPLKTAAAKQHQHQLMTQLRNAIYETYQSPPDGCTEATIVARRKKLEGYLKELESQNQQSKNEALEAYNRRWAKSLHEQVTKEKKLKQEERDAETRSNDALKLAHTVRDLKIHSRNETAQGKIEECAQHLADEDFKRRVDLDAEKGRQHEVYMRIVHEREKQAQDWLQRSIDSTKKAQDLLENKRRKDQEERDEKEREAAARRRAADERLEALKKRKEREAKERKQYAQEAFRKGHVRKIRVTLSGGTVKMEPVELDHKKRVEDMEKDEERTKIRVAREREGFNAMFRAPAVARAHRNHDNWEENYNDILRKHELKMMALQLGNLEAGEEAARRKMEQQCQDQLRSKLKEESVNVHRARHHADVHGHQDKTKRRAFNRWNRQMAQVSQELGMELPEGVLAGNVEMEAPKEKKIFAIGAALGGGRRKIDPILVSKNDGSSNRRSRFPALDSHQQEDNNNNNNHQLGNQSASAVMNDSSSASPSPSGGAGNTFLTQGRSTPAAGGGGGNPLLAKRASLGNALPNR